MTPAKKNKGIESVPKKSSQSPFSSERPDSVANPVTCETKRWQARYPPALILPAKKLNKSQLK